MEEQIPKGNSCYTWERRKGSGNTDVDLEEDLYALYGKENAFVGQIFLKPLYQVSLSREIMITVRL